VLKVGSDEPAAPGEMGELVFRGASSLLGYYNAPEQSRETLTDDGFVRTSDLVKAHVHDGVTYYSFEGRLKDNINRGGEKYGTEEVENLIREHPAVADAAVVAMPDPVFFEKGCAFIIPKTGQKAPDVAMLGKFLAATGLAKFKLPERIEAIDAFPVTRVGKMDKARLRAMITERLKQEEI
jgi:non-ribosomal peptide synthetase component E (peptide arylation enzyme)